MAFQDGVKFGTSEKPASAKKISEDLPGFLELIKGFLDEGADPSAGWPRANHQVICQASTLPWSVAEPVLATIKQHSKHPVLFSALVQSSGNPLLKGSAMANLISDGNVTAVKKLLEWGAEPNAICFQEPPRQPHLPPDGKRPLILAVSKIGAEDGREVDPQYIKKWLPIMQEMMKVLIDAGADINAASVPQGVSALHEAVCFEERSREKGHADPTVKYLLDTGADPEARLPGRNARPIDFAASAGRVSAFKLHASHGASVEAIPIFVQATNVPNVGNSTNYLAETLHGSGNVEMIRAAAAAGADMNTAAPDFSRLPLIRVQRRSGRLIRCEC